MKFMTAAVAAAGALAATGFVNAATAAADADAAPATHPLGTQGQIVNGSVIQGWTISNLKPSTDTIPYQPRGALWEATATDEAIQGGVVPVIANIGARAADGQTYMALFGVPTAQGVNPSGLSQGQKTSGKVYFDVTGQAPDSAIYQDSGKTVAVWVQQSAPASAPASGPATVSSPSAPASSTLSATWPV